MNEFDFGHNLMVIRKSRKLSQYQLGFLVGLTDKAVSKWETNKAKPSFEVIMKLAGQLNCSTDELMGTAEEVEKEKTFSAKKERLKTLWEEAENRLYSLYGNTPPLFVTDRFLREKHMLEKSDALIQLELIQVIQKIAEKEKARLEINGPLYGCLVSWLLGASEINPLPAHWRCPKCKRTVLNRQSRCGWDLEERVCECGETMERDGLNLPLEIQIYNSEDAFSSIRCLIGISAMEETERRMAQEAQKYYAVRRFHEDPDRPERMPFTCLFFGEKKEDRIYEPDYLERVTELYNWSSKGQFANFILMYIPEIKKGGRKAKERIPKTDELLRKDLMIKALEEAVREHQGRMEYMEIVQRDPNPEDYREIITFGKYVSLLCAINSHYMTDGIADLAEKLGISDVSILPTSPEDIWQMALDRTEEPELARGIAAELTRKTCRGDYISGITKRDTELFRQLNLPDWFPMFARNVMNLVSRSQNTRYGYTLLKKAWEKEQIERGK